MPQDTPMHIPFPARVNPDAARVADEEMRWLLDFGLLRSPEAVRRHRNGGYTELGVRFHPAATGEGLDLAIEQQSWFFLFDDQFDGPRGDDPVQAQALVDAVRDVLRHPAEQPDGRPRAPIVAAFADVWARSRHGMSDRWRSRAERHWHQYLESYVAEARRRSRDEPPTEADYLPERRRSIGVQPTLDMAERAGHYEVPQRAFTSAPVAAMRRLVADFVILDNDLVSLEKEEARGDPHNLVLVLRRERGLSRDAAIEEVGRMRADRVEEFTALEERLPRECDRLELTAVERDLLDRYRHDALRSLVRGVHDWAQQAGRYTAAHIIPAERPGYLDDLGKPPDGT
ncbi:pentalenene synthase [Kitasatospora sp. NPDC056783]|uniref:terpene synthase family protein n=1 Tax=Kitasatospora sp. NPDC056783 TaxID=3345943 RepID=UPI0036791404